MEGLLNCGGILLSENGGFWNEKHEKGCLCVGHRYNCGDRFAVFARDVAGGGRKRKCERREDSGWREEKCGNYVPIVSALYAGAFLYSLDPRERGTCEQRMER
jgi:hypothetical protein